MTKINQRKIKKDYFIGLKYKEIATKNNITINQLKNLILKNKWKRNNRSISQKGNKNAVGNKGGKGIEKGEKIALKTGEYEQIFTSVLNSDELQILNNYTEIDKKKELENEYIILTIRERRMLERIKKLQDTERDMYIAQIEKRNLKVSSIVSKSDEIETKTLVENTTEAIQRIEDALTRVQDTKRKCIDSLNKLNVNNTFNLNFVGTNNILASINNQLQYGGDEDAE